MVGKASRHTFAEDVAGGRQRAVSVQGTGAGRLSFLGHRCSATGSAFLAPDRSLTRMWAGTAGCQYIYA